MGGIEAAILIIIFIAIAVVVTVAIRSSKKGSSGGGIGGSAMGLSSYMKQDLSPKEQLILEGEFNKRKKSMAIAYILWFFFGLHYGYMNKWGWQVLYWLTLGGLFIWALIDAGRIPSMVNQINEDIQNDIALRIVAFRKSVTTTAPSATTIHFAPTINTSGSDLIQQPATESQAKVKPLEH